MADEFIYTCNCFFDICLLSYSKKEDFKLLCARVKNFYDKKLAKLQKTSSCSCTSCTPYCIWMLREVNREFSYVSK